jgi:mono/diheme cytochrome c family protein
MTSLATRISTRAVLALLILAAILFLLALALFAPPDGNERAEWLQFAGHFHPLAVHLPIALLLLVPVLELAGRSRHFPHLLPSVDFVLFVATVCAIAAAFLGWSLARSSSYSGSLVTQHMWSGISVAACAWLCWWLRARNEFRFHSIYALTLIVTVGVVSFAGYRGGQLSQGENHLTEHMPGVLRDWLGVPDRINVAATSANGRPGTFYAASIQPVFTNRCISCHGAAKHKNNLRLDSYDAAMRGGKHGAVIKAGDAKDSDLFRRISLSPSSDDFMPSDNKPPLTENEVKLIGQWISSGASGTQMAESAKDSASSSPPARVVPDVSIEEIDPVAVERKRAQLAATVTQLRKKFPSSLDYESRGSAELTLNASLLGQKFGDEDMAALAPINDHIVIADFSGTAITDRSSAALAGMKRLRSLRLMHTKITDATIQALAPLSQLQSLNLFDTPVTSASLAVLERLPQLRHLYVQQTKISPSAPTSEGLKEKLVF